MLTDTQRAEGWVAHDGGECPVPLDSCPDVMFRDGAYEPGTNWPAKYWARPLDWWRHQSPDRSADIIAYRKEPTNAD